MGLSWSLIGTLCPNETVDDTMDLFDQVIIDTMKEYKIKCGSVIIGQEGKILYRQGTNSIFFL